MKEIIRNTGVEFITAPTLIELHSDISFFLVNKGINIINLYIEKKEDCCNAILSWIEQYGTAIEIY